ncbi:hypothetical protein EST38_g1137 [Candolleomyces aberdarensis]|uniref:Uncharacterized protein n=1 Tax=Candolleomyces aberdarensis TaxID=2316362 RepID=A0A4Q2DWG8_9AGAR|nr:hypothetical protein EST38_g1137 [Candolleomyces aberdarensis]
MSSSAEHTKLPLPQYLKLLTNGNVPVAKAMAAAGKIYKEHGSPSQLALLTDFKLKTAGIEDAADRKLILAAFRKAGFAPKRKTLKRTRDDQSEESAEKPSSSAGQAGPSSPSHSTATTTQPTSPTKRRRTQTKSGGSGSFDFNEVLDEDILKSKFIVVNRAPVMTAWATVVAERLNFKREEALSIASVYTEMNAVSKGITLGLYDKKKEQGLEASTNGAQPYVELIGRRVPVYRTQDEQWRALSNSNPVSPMTAFGYLSRSFQQSLPHVIGTMRLLAESYDPSELNAKAWILYTSFRPEIDQWGKKSQLFCSKILALRKTERNSSQTLPVNSASQNPTVANVDSESNHPPTSTTFTEEGAHLSLEEYEAALDEDHTFDEVNLDFSEPQSNDASKDS